MRGCPVFLCVARGTVNARSLHWCFWFGRAINQPGRRGQCRPPYDSLPAGAPGKKELLPQLHSPPAKHGTPSVRQRPVGRFYSMESQHDPSGPNRPPGLPAKKELLPQLHSPPAKHGTPSVSQRPVGRFYSMESQHDPSDPNRPPGLPAKNAGPPPQPDHTCFTRLPSTSTLRQFGSGPCPGK